MSLINPRKIENVTLYTGSNGSNYCVCNCPCCSQKGKKRKYQGNLEQAIQMFDLLPNMKQLYLLGNPDVVVDTDFCHKIMVEAVKRNITVCFSTSGIGGEFVLKKLLDEIPMNMVDYISFSFDGITAQEMTYMKGVKYPFEKALKGLEWALKIGYKVKIQPTLWSCNYTRTKEIISFFRNLGVKWFTFHIGSLESGVFVSTHRHLTSCQVSNVHNQIEMAVKEYKDIKVRCPIIYLKCGENDQSKWYCMNPEKAKELQIMFTEDGIKVTHAPMASIYMNELEIDLNEISKINIPSILSGMTCPFSYQLGGVNDMCCRYISKYWNY